MRERLSEHGKVRPCVVGLAAVVALTFGFAASAFADSPTVTAPNGAASAKWQSAPDNWRLCDQNDGNGRSVYVHAGTTKANAEAGQRRYENFNGGCVTTAAYNLAGNPWWRVCENIGGGPDSCSAARQDIR